MTSRQARRRHRRSLGIGEAIAAALAGGAALVLADSSAERAAGWARTTAAGASGRAEAVAVDVANEALGRDGRGGGTMGSTCSSARPGCSSRGTPRLRPASPKWNGSSRAELMQALAAGDPATRPGGVIIRRLGPRRAHARAAGRRRLRRLEGGAGTLLTRALAVDHAAEGNPRRRDSPGLMEHADAARLDAPSASRFGVVLDSALGRPEEIVARVLAVCGKAARSPAPSCG